MSASDEIDRLTSQYLPRARGIEELFENETDKLLYGALIELQIANGRKPRDIVLPAEENVGESTEKRGDSEGHTLDIGSDPEDVELDLVGREFDLRFSDKLEVAFQSPTEDTDWHTYRSSDSPVTGIPVETEQVWLKSPNGSQTVYLDAWGRS